MTIHIDEDGACSWCGWRPDDDLVAHLAFVWHQDASEVWRSEWELHVAKHRSGYLPRPRPLTEEEVLAEVRALLWLARQEA